MAMAQIHIRQRKDGTFGLFNGKRCLIHGPRSKMYNLGLALRKVRRLQKEQAS